MNKLNPRPVVRALVTRRLVAPATEVFDAWLNRERLGRWMFGPAVRDEEIVHLSLNPHVGGAFSYSVEREGAVVEHVGKFLELARPHRLAFTWIVTSETAGSRVQVDIVDRGDECELTLTQEIHPSWAEAISAIEEEWQLRFDQLAVIVE